MLLFLDTKPAKEGGSIALGVPAFHFGEFLLKLRCTDTVGIGEISLGIKCVFFLHHFPEGSVTAKNGFHHCTFIELKVILTEHRHAFARTLAYSAVGRGELSAQNSHKRTFSSTISADNSITVSGSELQVNVLKQNSFTKLNT